MQKWEYDFYYGPIVNRDDDVCSNISYLWDKSYLGDNGKTTWETVCEYGRYGWELVAVTPVITGEYGITTQIMYTFKRPIEE